MPKPLIQALIATLILFNSTSPALAQTQEWSTISPNCVQGDVATFIGFFCLLRNAVSLILPILAIALFIMLVIGGYQYLLSGGDAKSVEGAKSTFTMAIGGIVVLLIGWAILFFLTTFTGVDLINLVIPDPS